MSLNFWKNIGPTFPTTDNQDVKAVLSKAISSIADPCIVLDIGGGDFSDYTSSSAIYNLLAERHRDFTLHIADIKSPIKTIKKNVKFHVGDLDDLFTYFNIGRINLATALSVLIERRVEGSADLTRETIIKKVGIENAKKFISTLKSNNPKLIEMRDSHLKAIDGKAVNVVNYSRFEVITATKT